VNRVARQVVFRLDGRRVPEAATVSLVGAFPQEGQRLRPLTLDAEGWWAITLVLRPGEYRYLFMVDGVPWNDPEDDGRVRNEWGSEYSVRIVR